MTGIGTKMTVSSPVMSALNLFLQIGQVFGLSGAVSHSQIVDRVMQDAVAALKTLTTQVPFPSVSVSPVVNILAAFVMVICLSLSSNSEPSPKHMRHDPQLPPLLNFFNFWI